MIKDSLYTLITQIFRIFGKLIYTVVINRALGPAGKGLFELLQLAPNTLMNFGTFGYNESNTYFTGKKPEKINNIIGNSYRLAMTFSMVAVALGAIFLLLPVNQPIFERVPLWVGFVALAIIPIGLIDLFLEATLYGENRIWVRNWHQILRSLTAIVYIGVLVVIFNMYVLGAVYGFIAIHITLLIFSFVILSRYHNPFGGKFDFALAKESWKFARFSWGANFAQYLLLNIDKWLIFVLASDVDKFAQVGLYSAAVSVIANVWIFPASIQTALIPKITQKGESERVKLVPPSIRVVTIIVAFSMIVLALIGNWALDFLLNDDTNLTAVAHRNVMAMTRWNVEPDWTEAYTPMMLLMPAIFSMSFAKIFAADFFSRGKPYISMWVSIFALVNNVIMNFILIPSDWMIGTLPIGGMNGAAIASSIAYTLSFSLFLFLYIRESGQKSRDLFIPKKEDFLTIWAWLVISFRNAGKKNETETTPNDEEGNDVG